MNDKSKSSFSVENSTNKANLSSNYSWGSDKKNSGNNDWRSVPVTYDKEESTQKHEKTATNNQWCSTSK